jgi:hypothetical protein
MDEPSEQGDKGDETSDGADAHRGDLARSGTDGDEDRSTARIPVVPSSRATRSAQRRRTLTAVGLMLAAIVFVAVVWWLGARSDVLDTAAAENLPSGRELSA